jgi:hypothetical protein
VRRPRNVMREIRREHRDPYQVRLKSVAPHSRDPRQLLFPNTTPPAKPAPAVAPWPEHQVDLEEYIAVLPPKEKP